MRFALAVLAGALVLGVAFLRMPGINSPLLSAAVIVLSALATGFFAGRRGALAGLLIVYLGNLIFVFVTLVERGLPADGSDPSGVAGFLGRLVIVQLVLLPFGVAGAAAGWLGAYARRRLVR